MSDTDNVEQLPKRYPNRFRKGDGRDRKRGINKNTRILKEAIMLAAEIEGHDGQGKGKLVGFLRRVAQEDLRAFCMLLGRVIPLQVDTRNTEATPKEVVYKSLDEVKRELASRGISMDIMMRLERYTEEEEEDDDGRADAGANGVL
jgi:hypothetical protein